MTGNQEMTIYDNWLKTAEMALFLLDQDGLTNLDDWGGKETVREILPEEYQRVFDMVQIDLINTILKDKNRGQAVAFSQCLKDFVEFAQEKIAQGRPCCYHYFAINVEILLALDLVPICYELFSGLTSALYTDGCEEGIDRIEAEGFPDHLCSSQKGCAGFLLMGVVPKPDVILKSSTPCDPSNMLYQWTARKYNAPFIVLDAPYYHNERGIKFTIGELKRMIEELERISGNTLDEDKLREYVKLGNKSIDYFLKLQELKKLTPCPDTGWHKPADTIFITQVGTPMGAEYFQRIYEMAKEKADRGEGVIPEDKEEIRAVWGYTWNCYDLPFFDWLEEEHGVTYLADTLTYFSPDTGMVDTSNMETMLEGLAWRRCPRERSAPPGSRTPWAG
ncbi:MAG: 2-hydroxyacyl-CoA dehydratase family protein [Actinomycetota bacterium]|nr:2-hydroxyacyl-CoA dehydratase family protein [Actinomycetota bacterium]